MIKFVLHIWADKTLLLCEDVVKFYNLERNSDVFLNNPIIIEIRENTSIVDDTDEDSDVQCSIDINSLDKLVEYLRIFKDRRMSLYFGTDYQDSVRVSGSFNNQKECKMFGAEPYHCSVNINRDKDDADLSSRITKAIKILKGQVCDI